ncbi:DUF2490 domain-containing protein [Winogradskyella alexanderae]|uniref:DUF2490 domain-containing protein n=1 Tax=Winogradskyella alexanderae TaxID=2877123 RepID=A0ABS7XSL8_9FLAO|nr:DUF2490 domain-containing protein [Winogradskyella alexanderae]MCA0131846.1 DUF2490 domain-containing protein [Winogradskyella alexanderae]
MKYILFALFALTILFTSKGQNLSEDYLGSWYTYGSSHRLNERFSIHPYGELRFYEASSNYNLAFISLRTEYHFKNNQSLGLGYAYLDIDTVFEFDNQPNVHENRLLEQYTISHKHRNLKIAHRVRFEHRFLDFRNRNELQNRFRYRIKFTFTVDETLSLVMSEEPFVNFQDQVFHENRFYAGLGVNVAKNSQIQLGYLKQHIRDNNLNRLILGISIKTDSRKL